MNPAESEPIPDHRPNGCSFEGEVVVVLQELRPALAEILERVEPPVLRASHLRQRLKLSQKVSWSIFNAATSRDARTLASLLPGRRGMERFFAACAEHGVPRETIERARAAFARFEDSVARHASSRDAFEAMLTELDGGNGDAGAAALRHKRAAFRANALLWGRQVRVSCSARIVHPGATPGLLDSAVINGNLGLLRTRRDVPLHMISRVWRWAHPGDPADAGPPQPIDPRETGPEAIGLMRDFCTQPLPEFRLMAERQGHRSYELVNDRLGSGGEVNYFIGRIFRNEATAPAPGTEGLVNLSKAVSTPGEAYIGDVLIHRSLCERWSAEVKVFASSMDGSTEFRDSDILPLHEPVEALGVGIDAARTPLIPRYAEILAYAMNQLGWPAHEFRVFRCRVEYPVLYSRIRMSVRHTASGQA